MSMSMYVIGIATSNERHEKMLAVVEACSAVGEPPPQGVLDYFANTIDEYGEVNGATAEHELQRRIPHRKWTPKNRDWAQEGFEVDVADLPADVTTIRFYCSW